MGTLKILLFLEISLLHLVTYVKGCISKLAIRHKLGHDNNINMTSSHSISPTLLNQLQENVVQSG